MSILQDLIGSNHTWASERASTAAKIVDAVHLGQLTKDEATELLQDMIATDKLDKEANDFTVRTQLVNAITTLISLVSSITPSPKS